MSVVAFDNGAKVSTGGTSTATMVVSFAATPNAVLIVGITVAGSDLTASAVLCNGVALTQYGRVVNDSTLINASMWVLTACPAGTLSISANMVGGVAGSMCMGGCTYVGARTTGGGPFGTPQYITAGAVTTAAISLSTSLPDMVVIMAATQNNLTASNANTRLQDGQHHNYKFWDAAGASGAVSISASLVATGTSLAWVGVDVIASASAGSIPSYMCLTGVGN